VRTFINNKEIGVYASQTGCKDARKCANNACFWRQTAIYGRCPWTMFINPENPDPRTVRIAKLQDYLDNKYGCEFPTIKAKMGTNVWTFYCEDYIKLETE
jgi:hypothetical protein